MRTEWMQRSLGGLVLAVLGATVACRPVEGASRPAGETSRPSVRPSFDLHRVVEQVHFAYRPVDDGFEGRHTTYAVKTSATAFSVTPSQPAAASGEGPKGAAVHFGAPSIQRGSHVLSLASAKGEVQPDGHLALSLGPVTQHLHNRDSGVEQSWTFAARPDGQGDLLVRVPVQARFLGATESGLHFAGGESGPGLAYSHGTWVDKEGKRSRVKAVFEKGAIALRVPQALMDASSFPATLDPTISPELGTDVPVTSPPSYVQGQPAVAFDGTNFLVVWDDGRGLFEFDLFGARVSPAGEVLDPSGIAISTSDGSQFRPDVAFDGANYLVVWQDLRSGASYDIFGARLSPAGAVLDGAGIPISTGTLTSHQLLPAVACSSTQCLVVWQDDRTSATAYDIFGTFVSRTGVVSHPQGLPLSTAALAQEDADVVSDGTNFLVVWKHSTGSAFDIHGAVVSASGALTAPDFGLVVEPSADQSSPVVSYDGTGYLLVWADRRLGTYDINAERVSTTGVASPFFPISTAAGDQILPAVSFDGSNHLVVWADARSGVTYDVFGRHVSPGGVVVGTADIPISTGVGTFEQVPAVASGAGGSLVVWQDDRNTRFGDDIFGARVTSAGAVADPSGILISTSANRQRDPAIAFDGANFLVVWQDDRVLGEVSIRGTRMSPTGVVLDPTGIELASARGDQNAPAFPAIAFDGTHFLVVWRDLRSDAGDIYGARVTREGTVLEPDGFVISAGTGQQYDPSIAFDGANFMVVWADTRAGSNDIYGARVSPGGSVLEPSGIAISTALDAQTSPWVAFGGTHYLVVWEDQRAVPAGTEIADIYGARVTPAGVVLETGGTPIAQGPSNQVNPKVAFDGSHFLVVWEDNRSDVSDIYGARVTPGLSVVEPNGIPISTAVRGQLDVAVGFDGDNFLVVWRDERDSSFLDVYGARVRAAGSVLEPEGFVISSEPTSDHYHPAVASMGAGQSMVVYARFALSPDLNADRVRGRIVSFPASNPATSPVAHPQTVQTQQGAPVVILLTGADPEGDALTFSVTSPPSHGTLSGTAPSLLYAPSAGFAGVDSFTFRVNDGVSDSAPATVHVVVQPERPENQVPVPVSQVLSTPEDTPLPLTLTATDAEGDALRFAILVAPRHGTLSGTPPNLTYHPAPDAFGPDSFTFTADDGRGLVGYGVISLDVTPRNDAPACASAAVTAESGSDAAVVLSAADVEQSALTFTILTQPSHGTLSGAPPHLIYTAAEGFTGTDSFTYEASDGAASCASTRVTLLVLSSDAPPPEEPEGPVGCSTSGGASGASLLSLVSLWVLARMRRRAPGEGG